MVRNIVRIVNHFTQTQPARLKMRSRFRAGLAQTKFMLPPSEGTDFQWADISAPDQVAESLNDADFCKWLTSEIGVAAIPLSAL